MNILSNLSNLFLQIGVARLPLLQDIAVNVIFWIWGLTTLLLTVQLIRIGFNLYGNSDSKSIGEAKGRIPKIIGGVALIFGAYMIVTVIINLIGIKDPNGCFQGEDKVPVAVRIFFPDGCK